MNKQGVLLSRIGISANRRIQPKDMYKSRPFNEKVWNKGRRFNKGARFADAIVGDC